MKLVWFTFLLVVRSILHCLFVESVCVCVLYNQEIKILFIIRADIVHALCTCVYIGNQIMMMMLCNDFVYSDDQIKLQTFNIQISVFLNHYKFAIS